MTREEAIEWIYTIDTDYDLALREQEALDMAIEALSIEPNCKKCAIKELWQATEKEDLVAVVRCKDCEWKYVKGNTTNYYWCRENDCPVDDNDFCSWAKMKGGME